MARPAGRRDSARETATPIATPAIDHSVARALATVVSNENRLAFARSFTFATARAYAAALDGDLPEFAAPSDVSLIPLGAAAVDAAAKFGAALVRAAPASAVYLLTRLYLRQRVTIRFPRRPWRVLYAARHRTTYPRYGGARRHRLAACPLP
jgi:hypothetical protein